MSVSRGFFFGYVICSRFLRLGVIGWFGFEDVKVGSICRCGFGFGYLCVVFWFVFYFCLLLWFCSWRFEVFWFVG